MITLDTISRSLEVVLGNTITTNQLPIVATYVDVTASPDSYVPKTNTTQTNNATAVTAVAAPAASTQRQIKFLSVRNDDTVPATIIVRYNDNSTIRIIVKFLVYADDLLVYTDGEGFRVFDNEGNLRQGQQAIMQYQEDSQHTSGAMGTLLLGVRNDASGSLAGSDGDYSPVGFDSRGRLRVIDSTLDSTSWSYAAASGGITNTSGVTIKAAAGAGVRNYLTDLQIINGHASTSTDVQIRDGSSGTVLWRGFAQAAGGGISIHFNTPLKSTANTLLEVACGTTGTATYVNAQGFTAAE